MMLSSSNEAYNNINNKISRQGGGISRWADAPPSGRGPGANVMIERSISSECKHGAVMYKY